MKRDDGALSVTVDADNHGGRITITGPDQVGLLAAVTGVVALHRLDVRRASATGTGGPASQALIELFVQPRHGDDLPSGPAHQGAGKLPSPVEAGR